MSTSYEVIGANYAELRRPDPRIAAEIESALGDARRVVNVGAGTGSYEPSGREVMAVESSAAMIRQRPLSSATAVQAAAEDLPFEDRAFDAAMAILTVHHWSDKRAGMEELRRVVRGRIVLLTYDPAARPWLTGYLPQLAALDEQQMPRMEEFERWLGPVDIRPLMIPHDCTDGFLHAFWRRPAAYLDPRIRSGSSSFWLLDDLDEGLERLAGDLATGEWERRYAEIMGLNAYDAGYRLIVAEPHEA